jgi:hypothetical protein
MKTYRVYAQHGATAKDVLAAVFKSNDAVRIERLSRRVTEYGLFVHCASEPEWSKLVTFVRLPEVRCSS